MRTSTRARLAARPLIPFIFAMALISLGLPAQAEAVCTSDGANCTTIFRDTYTLSVSRTQGTVTSVPAGIDCGSDCTQSQTYTTVCDDAGCGEQTPAVVEFTLTANFGSPGFAPSWTGCDSVVSGQCHVALDADRSVTLTWIDVTDPETTLSGPSTVGPSVKTFTATATDNSGVTSVMFRLDGGAGVIDSTPGDGFNYTVGVASYLDGSSHTLTAAATDASGRIDLSPASKLFTVDRSTSLSLSQVPAVTNAATVPVTITHEAGATTTCRLNAGEDGQCSATNGSRAAGFASESRLAACSGGVPIRMRFTGTSRTLPESVRGTSSTT